MFLKGGKDDLGFAIPLYFRNKVTIGATCSLQENEVKLFNIALQETYEQLMFVEQIDIEEIMMLAVVFVDDGKFVLEFDKGEGGAHLSLAVYNMEKLRLAEDDTFMLFGFIEELAHHFWCIEDEVKVKYKVEEILKRYDRTFTLDYMRRRWKIIGLE